MNFNLIFLNKFYSDLATMDSVLLKWQSHERLNPQPRTVSSAEPPLCAALSDPAGTFSGTQPARRGRCAGTCGF
ncbi:unnamed protein product [Nesidiocoris tenuis]|uniref:Uncharacterized protein n=1 Tax=Nesidiocoris tenuis TaxID=355587 RepID=A0A6H5HGE3_9HEMI|nr:unnamed protein product [Nesidiocoris tenuis]CAB0016177.1 unnamed protein product [Nesidiocoris tenuis]